MNDALKNIGWDVALCFDEVTDNLYAACHISGKIAVRRFSATADDLHQQLVKWRKQEFGYPTDAETVYRMMPTGFMEQTRIAALGVEILLLNDQDLIRWFETAEKMEFAGTDGKPVFDAPFAKTVYDFSRLSSGLISLTELPLEALEAMRFKYIRAVSDLSREQADTLPAFSGAESPPVVFEAAETRLRAFARSVAEGTDREYFKGLQGLETIAFLAASPDGIGFAFWNANNGFYAELGEHFHLYSENVKPPEGMDAGEFAAQLYGESVYNFLNEQFYRRIFPENQAQMPVDLKRIYWTTTASLVEPLQFLINDFAAQTGLPFCFLPGMEERLVTGLLLGASELTTELVGAVNLANGIELQAAAIHAQTMAQNQSDLAFKRRKAMIYLALPVVLAIGLIVGLLLNNWRVSAALDARNARASAEKTRLQPLLTARAESEKTRAWFEDVLRQIVGLRKKQTAALGFAARIDPLLPTGGDFFVSGMKIVPGGDFEIKGLARNEAAVSEFFKALEFASDDQDARYFSNLTMEFKQGSERAADQTSIASGVTGTLAPGVSGFLIKGNFAPASVIKAQENKPVAPVPQSAPPVNPNTPNSPNSAPANANTPVVAPTAANNTNPANSMVNK